MKFSQHVEFYKIPEWANEYVDYNGLKKELNRVRQILKGIFSVFMQKERGLKREPDFESFDNSESDALFSMHFKNPTSNNSILDEWLNQFNANIDKTNKFYLNQITAISLKLDQLKHNLESRTVFL